MASQVHVLTYEVSTHQPIPLEKAFINIFSAILSLYAGLCYNQIQGQLAEPWSISIANLIHLVVACCSNVRVIHLITSLLRFIR